MPLDDKDVAQIQKLFEDGIVKFSQTLPTVIGQHIDPLHKKIEESQTKIFAEVPGMVERIGKKFVKVDDKGGAGGGQGGGGDDEEKVTLRTRLADLEKKNNALTESHTTLVNQLETTAVKGKLTAAIGDKFIDSNEPLELLLPQIKKKADGTLYVPGKRQVAGSTVVNDVELSLEEAVENVASTKKHWLKASLGGGGTGATGEGGRVATDFTTKPTWDQLQRDPKLLGEWMKHDQAYVLQLQDANIRALREAKAKEVQTLRSI